MAKVTFELDTEIPMDLAILGAIQKNFRIDAGPAPKPEEPQAAEPAKAPPKTAKPPATKPQAVPDPKPEPPAEPVKDLKDMSFEELAAYIPLQRKVTREHAIALGKASLKLHDNDPEVVGKVLNEMGHAKMKEVKDFKAFCQNLIAAEAGADNDPFA